MSRFESNVRSWIAISRPLPARRPHARRPSLERLEDRTVLSTISLVVTTLADTGVGTLRSAITMADQGAASKSYVIKFSVTLPATIDLLSALPDLSNNISIKGPGASDLTVQRDPNATALFSVFTVDSGETISLSGITISGGNAGGGNGGGVDNSGTLTVSDSVLTGNTALEGGGLFNAGTVTVTDSTFDGLSGSQSAEFGGGLYNEGTATVKDITFTLNTTFSSSGNSTFDGGAIYNASLGTVTVTNSTFTSNTANQGGGLANYGTATVKSSTFTSNFGDGDGGGIFNGGTLTASASTFGINYAELGGASTTVVRPR